MAFKPKNHGESRWSVYLIESASTERQYHGLSSAPASRIRYHNSGQLKSTKGPIDWILISERAFDTWDEANAFNSALLQVRRPLTPIDFE